MNFIKMRWDGRFFLVLPDTTLITKLVLPLDENHKNNVSNDCSKIQGYFFIILSCNKADSFFSTLDFYIFVQFVSYFLTENFRDPIFVSDKVHFRVNSTQHISFPPRESRSCPYPPCNHANNLKFPYQVSLRFWVFLKKITKIQTVVIRNNQQIEIASILLKNFVFFFMLNG